MKFEIDTKPKFQPVTVTLTFESLAELHSLKTALGLMTGLMIKDRIVEIGEEPSGDDQTYSKINYQQYEFFDNLYDFVK